MAKVYGALFGLCIFLILIISKSQSKLIKDVGYETYDVISVLPKLSNLDSHSIHTQDSNRNFYESNSHNLNEFSPSKAKRKSEKNNKFYISSIHHGSNNKYWNDVKKLENDNHLTSYENDFSVQLSFDFPFFGKVDRFITISKNGFIYMGEVVKDLNEITNYIAPLMLDFNVKPSEQSYIKFHDNGKSMIVIWENARLNTDPNTGNFTFSAKIYNNGDIVFKYYSIPCDIKKLNNVKIGLFDNNSDKSINHQINLFDEEIRNGTSIYLRPKSYALKMNRFKREVTVNSTTIVDVNKTQSRTNSRQLDVSSIETTTVEQPISSTSSPLVTNRPLLGVNGTGQRKDIPKPAIVSDPINPDTMNKNKTEIQAITLKPIGTVALSPEEEILENVDKFDIDTNKTLLQHNLTQFEEEYHFYYNSTMLVDEVAINKYWKSIENFTVNNLLSTSYRRAMTVQLSFDFPFYGHPIRNVTIATGGFLYTGEYVHSWLAATQYIAPLMANFDTSLSNSSFVKYYDNGTTFTVVWENVTLHEKPLLGTFTFSASLHKNGDIVFAYYSIPIYVESINDDTHPVKVGLSDAYIIDKTIFFARRKTIYEYHRVNFGNDDIKNGTIIYLTALPTCLTSTDCQSCLTAIPTLKCYWCPALNRCSTGLDRKRQDWLLKGCEKIQIVEPTLCPELGTKGNNAGKKNINGTDDHNEDINKFIHKDIKDDENSHRRISESLVHTEETTSRSGFGMVIGVLIPVCLILTVLLWVVYAYRNPHTKSGQFLIQYRPSQWSWRRGEARYTAATIHM